LNRKYSNNFCHLKKMNKPFIILFGASNMGIEALEYLVSQRVNVNFFCDNDSEKWGKELNGVEILPPSNLSKYLDNACIIISSSFVKEIKIQIQEIGFKNSDIFLFADGTLREICQEGDHIKETCLEEKFDFNKIKQNIFYYTHRVSIELSNICNYSVQHSNCPTHFYEEKIVLPRRIILDIFKLLNQYNFNGQISFHLYNEPLIDPRLFLLIIEAKRYCPNALTSILSNGFYLNQTIAEELVEAGLDLLSVTAYSDREFERLKAISVNVPYNVFMWPLDQRLSLYDYNGDVLKEVPCYAPLNEIIIRSTGDVGLCCLDWKSKYTFGNLYDHNIEEIISDGKMIEKFMELKNSDRQFEICKGCGWTR
jgi:radical SAM protein with 4Fe4S-binding SPASM domain